MPGGPGPGPRPYAGGFARLSRRRLLALGGALAATLVACDDEATPAPTPTAGRSPAAAPSATRTATPTPTAPPPTATPTATPTPAPSNPAEPTGFPLDPALACGLVVGEVGARTIAWGEGPTVERYTREDQPADDPVRANRCGWNARVHVEYEGQPAVDWYLPVGTPIRATMEGTATLLVNTTANPFDVYGVSREPYLGNPDRARAPVVPFPGPGGGQGVFVRVENAGFVTDYAHLDLAATMALVPAGAWLAGFASGPELLAAFGALQDFRAAVAVARWPVSKGDTLGLSGDSGYSEAPHLHYTVRRVGAANLLCPTAEAGFPENGWLLRPW